MLPLPLPRVRYPSLRELVRHIDDHLLWAFNPQPPLHRSR
jgi:hypothetical protein